MLRKKSFASWHPLYFCIARPAAMLPGSAMASCANTYCHSDGTNGTPELDIYTDSFSLVGSLTPACRA